MGLGCLEGQVEVESRFILVITGVTNISLIDVILTHTKPLNLQVKSL